MIEKKQKCISINYIRIIVALLILVPFVFPFLFKLFHWYIPGIHPFLDLKGRLSHIEANSLGINTYIEANPLDPLNRINNKPSISLLLSHTGIGVSDSNWIGWILVSTFLIQSISLLRKCDLKLIIACSFCILTPNTLFALERGNDDLIVFILAFAIPYLLNSLTRYSISIVSFIVVILGSLKYYPFTLFSVLWSDDLHKLSQNFRRYVLPFIIIIWIIIFGKEMILLKSNLPLNPPGLSGFNISDVSAINKIVRDGTITHKSKSLNFLYKETVGRNIDNKSLEYWLRELKNEQTTLRKIKRSIISTKEYQDRLAAVRANPSITEAELDRLDSAYKDKDNKNFVDEVEKNKKSLNLNDFIKEKIPLLILYISFFFSLTLILKYLNKDKSNISEEIYLKTNRLDRLFYIMGASMLVFCYLTSGNNSYRMIHSIFTIPLITSLIKSPFKNPKQNKYRKGAISLLILILLSNWMVLIQSIPIIYPNFQGSLYIIDSIKIVTDYCLFSLLGAFAFLLIIRSFSFKINQIKSQE